MMSARIYLFIFEDDIIIKILKTQYNVTTLTYIMADLQKEIVSPAW